MEVKTLDEALLPAYEKYRQAFEKLFAERNDERDVRVKHFELLASDLAEHINIIKCINVLGRKHPEDIEEVTNYTRAQIELLLENFQDTIIGDCFLKLVMRTELLLRTLYRELNPGVDISKVTIPQLVALFLNDTHPNWQKEQSKLLIMVWEARNSIHLSGIHAKADKIHTYKGKNYELKKDMKGIPFTAEELIFIMQEICEVMDEIVHSPAVAAIPNIDHPFFKVFGN